MVIYTKEISKMVISKVRASTEQRTSPFMMVIGNTVFKMAGANKPGLITVAMMANGKKD